MKKLLFIIVLASYSFATERQDSKSISEFDLGRLGAEIFMSMRLNSDLNSPFTNPPQNQLDHDKRGADYYEQLALASCIVAKALDTFSIKNKNNKMTIEEIKASVLQEYRIILDKKSSFSSIGESLGGDFYQGIWTKFEQQNFVNTYCITSRQWWNGIKSNTASVKTTETKCDNGIYYKFDHEKSSYIANFVGDFDLSVQNNHVRQTASTMIIYDSKYSVFCGKTYKIKRIGADKLLIQ